METIRVNMTPCEDIKTIHASQNDNEAREWGFELHNNGEKIDSSSISDQLVFKAYEGGTEEILPTNGSTPTTSPFLGDIKYPQGLLSDQEFLYRQSPTEEDGLAKITSIKGNTLGWNQLVENGNFATDTRWGISGGSKTVANNSLTITANGANPYLTQTTTNIMANHRYMMLFDATCSIRQQFTFNVAWSSGNYASSGYAEANVRTRLSIFLTPTVTPSAFNLYMVETTVGATAKLENVQLFDLTQMGLDISSPSDFTSLFSLPYYAYNQGTLLSFMGNGIKTVGKNLLNARSTYTTNGITFTNDNGVISINGTATASAFFTTNIGLRNGSYFIGAFNDEINSNVHIAIQNKSGAYPSDATMSSKNRTLSINNDIDKLIIYVNSGETLNNFVLKPMVSFESPEYFEPYIETATDLPISTYFPTGMKSAGTVYDELTPTKAIVRLIKTTVDGTNKTANYYGAFQGHQLFYIDVFAPTYVDYSNMANLKSNHYLTAINVTMNDRYIRYQASDNRANIGRIYWNDDRYTSASAMNTALQSSPLEIVSMARSETVENFSVASLVTENAEIPLSNEDGVLIGKCTEQLSENPGFIDAKIKLSDSDGECYSNKIQLHIERSPQ